ncbi:helix-turn-helix domain-containing protein [Paenarthrobacter nitroguajacolicus]|uniref:AraC-like ligand-binding domain-containing protein n=1 Tax=Paenarthrobacter nitroguajacolicus TaxID=211146 RepID=UPI00248A96F4|nr:helix-turn-helix domain-containing protein [Paenarthrobacter nitroguajacolicus]MDI2033546.1 Transcriptional activator NphR [Paenarthrobacter nitroguajacolicus]
MSGAIARQSREEFTTKVLATTDRFDAWNQAVNSAFVPLSVVAREPEQFDGGLINQTIGPVFLSAVSGTASHVSRGSKEIQANDPGLVKLGLQLRGYSVVAQDGREAALTPGDFAIYDTTRPYDLFFDDAFRMMVVMFPPEALHLNRKSIAALTASRVSGRQGLGSLTSALLGAVAHQLHEGSVAEAATVSDALMNLISAVFAERVPPSSPLTPERLALMERIEAFVAARLSDPELTVGDIAAAHNVSVRYLQKLFEERDDTVSAWLRRQRLEKCRTDLVDPSLQQRPVSAVGMHWGFTDASSFSRAFKSAFGYSPSEYRYSYRPA